MNLTEKKLSEEYIYKGRIIRLRKDKALLPDGNEALREVIEHPGGVGVIPIDEEGNVYLVRQFRYPYMEETLEIPAGKRDPGEEPIVTGKRELKEETGAEAKTYKYLGELYPSPGYCGEIIHMYAAKELTFSDKNPDDDEFIDTVKMPLAEAVERVMNGEFKDSKTQAAILKLKLLVDGGGF